MKHYLTLDIGGTKIFGTIMDAEGNILAKDKKKTRSEAGEKAVTEQLFKCIDGLFERTGLQKGDIATLGAGMPGILDQKTGTIAFTPNMPWKNYPFRKLVETRYGFTSYLGNDATLGMLGEWKHGAARGKSDVIGLFVGTGIGGGLVINGRFHEGATGAAGELGHMTLNPEGPYCGCGSRGCLEAYASKTAIWREIEHQLARGRKSAISVLMEGEAVLKTKALKKAIEQEDALVLEVLERSMTYLAAGVGSLVNALNPQMVVIGGGVAEGIGAYLLPILKAKMQRFVIPELLDTVTVTASTLGDNAINYGALALILDSTKNV